MRTTLKPWHEVVQVRDDLKTGELTLAQFAADLYDVVVQKGHRPIYESPSEFFGLTYPTFRLRELVKEVSLRLDGQSDRAYRQLSTSYGGGKTHSLVTLRHLVHDPDALPDLPAVKEFEAHIGFSPPKARVAALCFDKIDIEKGIETYSPDGKPRMLKHPWSVLAFQLAGSDGLRIIHPDEKDEERDTPPAEPLMVDLLSKPQDEGLATLVLVDEVLMYLRALVDTDESSQTRMANFFQYLCQAVVKVDTCAMVASILASDPRKYDVLGRQILSDISEIFGRQGEEDASPVSKEDAAEVLRRRFFTPESIGQPEVFRPYTTSIVRNIAELDEDTRNGRRDAENRYQMSYPFHPELTEIFYTRWTQLAQFQQARGLLRTFAIALRDAQEWDTNPLIGPNVLLSKPDSTGLSEAASELASLANVDPRAESLHEWRPILQGELDKAQAIQSEATGLGHREMEQSVMSVFLSSQPIGQKALTRELFVLTGATSPDKIELEKALRRWSEVSWFLDEADAGQTRAAEVDGLGQLPNAWRLGNRPNLRQMHHDACRNRVQSAIVESEMLSYIERQSDLTDGAASLGAKTHRLPDRPSDIADDGEFRYAVLGPDSASMSGKPSDRARSFIEQTTSPDRPRVHRNSLILAVPSRDGIEVVRDRIREHLGWIEVGRMLKDQTVDPIRQQLLTRETNAARNRIPDAVRQAYSIVVTVNESNKVHAFKIPIGNDPLFQTIKSDKRSRIEETPISAEALLLGGPYDLWREDEDSRRVNDLVNAFARYAKLPKMVNRDAILSTIAQGVLDGIWVAKVTRPDRSERTFWRTPVDDEVLKDPTAELVLPQHATLGEVSHALLAYGSLPGLWESDQITAGDVFSYFKGGNAVTIPMEGYDETIFIPECDESQVKVAIEEAVLHGEIWLLDGPTSILKESVPDSVLDESSKLLLPPEPVAIQELMESSIPDAWQNNSTNGFAIATGLNRKLGRILPWSIVKSAIREAISAQWVQLAPDSIDWDCDFGMSQNLLLRIPPRPHRVRRSDTTRPAGTLRAEATLEPRHIQDLADQMGHITREAAGNDLKINVSIEIGGDDRPPMDTVENVNKLLALVSEDLKLT